MATSATSARVGREEVTIESSICVAVIDGRAIQPASFRSFFCASGTCSIGSSMPRSPRATITQSAACRISSARSTASGFSIFAISGRRVCSRTSSHVLGAAHERERDHVDADRLAVAQQLEVLLGDRGQPDGRPGDVQPLARGDGAADLDLRFDLARGRAHLTHAQAHRAVGEVDHGVRLQRVGEAGPGDAHVLGVAEALLAVARPAGERDEVAGLQLDDVVAQRPDPQLRAGQVLQDRDRASRASRRVAHAADGLGVLVERAVGVVQARDVHPRLDHPQQGCRLARGGADGGDDLRAAHGGKVSGGGRPPDHPPGSVSGMGRSLRSTLRSIGLDGSYACARALTRREGRSGHAGDLSDARCRGEDWGQGIFRECVANRAPVLYGSRDESMEPIELTR